VLRALERIGCGVDVNILKSRLGRKISHSRIEQSSSLANAANPFFQGNAVFALEAHDAQRRNNVYDPSTMFQIFLHELD
jgi:hypothetical protein